ncbi:MAG TPA: TRAM domain-containing protein, partial [Bacteroidota bacterium]|nr:TRAM domain-containing protein [Bacteroidota bacterium]
SICNSIHLPVQSGSDRILKAMNRTYNRAHYLRLVDKIKQAIPDVCLSTDIIVGFPTETEEDHRETLELLKEVGYDGAFMFKYSPRENTPAYKMIDDVGMEIKTRRIGEIMEVQKLISESKNRRHVGQEFEILIEGESKKSSADWQGRTDGNKTVVVPKGNVKIGDYVTVKISRANSATLFGEVVAGLTVETEEAA